MYKKVNKMCTLTVRMTEEEKNDLNALAEKDELTMSQVVRKALKLYKKALETTEAAKLKQKAKPKGE